ncbi:hypothetical protein [Aneurinibacillus soli]|nr:hypothetical protein [Aneurinibacillus soli]
MKKAFFLDRDGVINDNPHPDYVYSSLHEACMSLVRDSGERHY